MLVSPTRQRLLAPSLLRKILFPHPFQRGADQVAIRPEEPCRNSGKLSFDSFCAILEHSRVLYGVFLRNDV